MTRTIFGKVMWLGRATVFLVGLAVILALVLGVAATAFGANGGSFILGKGNAATKVTGLVGRVAAGPALAVKNPSGGVALGLSVGDPLADPATKTVAPMKVDSQAVVGNLNSDELDGKDSTQFANAAHAHSGADISSGTVAEARIDGSVARDSEVMPTVRANDGAGSGLDADTLDGQSSGSFLGANQKAADSDKLDGKDSTTFGVRTDHATALAHNCDDPKANVCAPVTVTVPSGKSYVVSVWSSFSARDSGGVGNRQNVEYCSAGKGNGISTTNPCITPFGGSNTVAVHDYLTAASSSGETLQLSAGTYTFFTLIKPQFPFAEDSGGRVITKVMVRDATNGL